MRHFGGSVSMVALVATACEVSVMAGTRSFDRLRSILVARVRAYRSTGGAVSAMRLPMRRWGRVLCSLPNTVKNNVLVNAKGEIVLLTPPCAGKKHDKKIADEAAFTLPEGSVLYQDTGFQGFALEGTTIVQPKKKPARRGTHGRRKS